MLEVKTQLYYYMYIADDCNS